MHALFFATKRADQSILAHLRRLLAPHGLTPARFDMLYAITRSTSCSQEALRFQLGVSRPTISRMLKSLVALGFVTRHRTGRWNYIRLTESGRAVLRAAVVHVSKPVARCVHDIFAGFRLPKLATFMMVEDVLHCFQKAFAMRCWLLYTYGHPDD